MLTGKTAVVTGASRGIGRAIALKLSSAGANVAIVYAGNRDEAKGVEKECRAFGHEAASYISDVSDFAATKETIRKIKEDFGSFSILVNNAGITKDNLLMMMSEDDFDKVVSVNLKGAFNMIKHSIPLFVRQREGCIINISSISGMIGNAGQVNYAASKAGLIGLTKSVAKEYASKGVRCNAVAPGFIETDMTKKEENSPLVSLIPLGRMGDVEDVADAVFYLVCAKYVTGEVMRVDGGLAM